MDEHWRKELPGYVYFETWRYCGHSANDTLQRYKAIKSIDDDELGGYLLEQLS